MSAPVTERGRTAERTAAIPAQRGGSGDRSRGSATPSREQKAGERSARRAYARRDDRLRRTLGGQKARTAAPTGRAQFVLLIMALLVIGLVATLWFSTAAAADSYRLTGARAEARALSQQAEQLNREVAVLQSAPELARRAGELGMVPVQDPARLVVAPEGRVSVVGEPKAAVGRPRPQPAPAAAPAQPGPVAGQPETPGQPAPAQPVPAEPGPTQLAAGQAAQPEGPTVVAQGGVAGSPAAGLGGPGAGTGAG